MWVERIVKSPRDGSFVCLFTYFQHVSLASLSIRPKRTYTQPELITGAVRMWSVNCLIHFPSSPHAIPRLETRGVVVTVPVGVESL